MAEVRLRVNGKAYRGWQSVRVVRSIESVSGAFELAISDRWEGQAEPWPIVEGDECRVEIGDDERGWQQVIDGHVWTRRQRISAGEVSYTVSGKDRTAALVKCSAVLERWSFRRATVLEIARKVCEPFGIPVKVQPGIELVPQPKIAVTPGDSAWSVVERAAKAAGVLVVSDAAGGLLITRAGAGRAAPIVQGQNLLDCECAFSLEERFHRYIVATQTAGTDTAAGEATRVRAEAIDEGVRLTDHVLIVRPDRGLTAEHAVARVDWEARVRAARSESPAASVEGWRQPDGQLWPVNARTHLTAPAAGVDGDLLISQVEYSLGSDGEVTRFTLVRPDAFAPDPAVRRGGQPRVRQSLSTRWKRFGEELLGR